MKNLKVSQSIIIDASPEEVWDVLTNPEKISAYIGVETITDWKIQSAIIWQGQHQGQKYQDKGKVLQNVFGKILQFEYWSHFGGYDDIPENYSIITSTLDCLTDGKIKFTYEREKILTIEEQQMFQEYVLPMLQQIKELSEEG
ncbi:MAG: SRPBCC domain-containing protein [Chitinophagaceae bacterium]|nr:SRPBCC domain-containing protein [Chitinophagaceae bacterium]